MFYKEVDCDNEEEESGEEEESEESEEEELEPKLKYERVANAVNEILKADCASCMAVHSKVCHISCHSLEHKNCCK